MYFKGIIFSVFMGKYPDNTLKLRYKSDTATVKSDAYL